MSDVKVTSFVPQTIDGNTEGTLKGMLGTVIKVTTQAKLFANFEKGYQTGQAKGSIMWKGIKSSGGNTTGTILREKAPPFGFLSGSGLEHLIYLEFGTRYMAAQPVLRPAVDVVTNGLGEAQAMAKSMSDSVKRGL